LKHYINITLLEGGGLEVKVELPKHDIETKLILLVAVFKALHIPFDKAALYAIAAVEMVDSFGGTVIDLSSFLGREGGGKAGE